MITADHLERRSGKLLVMDRDGIIRHLPRSALASLFCPGDLVIANDAATLPASLKGTHYPSGRPIEIRLAAWISAGDPTQFVAIAFGEGDYRTRTEDRVSPPLLSPGDRLALGPLTATIGGLLEHPRLFRLSFLGDHPSIFAALARHGQPIQYAHVQEPLALYDVWTKIAANPMAFEPPSAGFALDWHTLARWRERGIGFATVTHAAGISSTGDSTLDLRLPFDEPYRIPKKTAAAIAKAKLKGWRVAAIGTTVARALESAASTDGSVRAGNGVATGRLTRGTPIRVVDAILSGVHQPGESHFELFRAFAHDEALNQISAEIEANSYRNHEFGDSILVECRPSLFSERNSNVRDALTLDFA
jgi:S-adenosylmethionine:tRNA ribosyltransferase-isomerase